MSGLLEKLMRMFGERKSNMYTPMQENQIYTDTPITSKFDTNPVDNELQRKYAYLKHMDKSDRPSMTGADRTYLSNLMKHIPQPLLLRLMQQSLDRKLDTAQMGWRDAPLSVNLNEREYLDTPNQQWDTVRDPKQKELLYNRGVLPRIM